MDLKIKNITIASGEAVLNYKNCMLYHYTVVEATRAMLEDASKSIGFFSMLHSDDFQQYMNNDIGNVDEIVKRVMETVNNK